MSTYPIASASQLSVNGLQPLLLKTGVNLQISTQVYQQAQTVAVSADTEALGSLCNLLAAFNRITRAASSY